MQSNTILILAFAVLMVACLTGAIFIFIPTLGSTGSAARQRFRSMVGNQRSDDTGKDAGLRRKDALAASQDVTPITRGSDSKLTLQKKLKFARWTHIPPYVISVSQIAISLLVFLLTRQVFGTLLQLVALTTGPIVVNTILMHRVNARFKKFDSDYPQFLMSLVGLLKTGMNPVQALGAASEGLGEDSLVRLEVESMLERMRLGISEDRSIGSFGEDVNHAEIELFVQALLLSRRVGGTLSDSLERLAKQVRKRQFFRRSANAAVAQQRGSMYMILAILAALELYLYLSWRQGVTEVWYDAQGKSVCEFALVMMIGGLYWSRQVSKIRA